MTAQNDPSPASPVGGEAGWLIEKFDTKRQQYMAEWWALGPALGEDEQGWTKDSLLALRFARKQDAQAYIDNTGWTEARPTEHGWPNLAALSAPSVTGEAVAWRMRQMHHEIDGPITGWQFTEIEPNLSASRHRYEVQPLYAAPVSAHEGGEAKNAQEVKDLIWWLRQYPIGTDGLTVKMKANEAADALAALSPTAVEQGSGAFPAKQPVIPTEREDGAVLGLLSELVEACQPIAAKARQWDARHGASRRDSVQVDHRIGDFRRIRDLLDHKSNAEGVPS